MLLYILTILWFVISAAVIIISVCFYAAMTIMPYISGALISLFICTEVSWAGRIDDCSRCNETGFCRILRVCNDRLSGFKSCIPCFKFGKIWDRPGRQSCRNRNILTDLCLFRVLCPGYSRGTLVAEIHRSELLFSYAGFYRDLLDPSDFALRWNCASGHTKSKKNRACRTRVETI